MRVVFFGTGTVAATVLQKVAAQHEVQLVVTPPPTMAGRKLRQVLSPVAVTANTLGLSLSHDNGGDESNYLLTQIENAEVVLVCDYGILLPRSLLAAARHTLNVHPSLLPRWRGAAPIERALLAGDSKTGVTIMQLNAHLDGGEILAQQEIPIANGCCGGELTTQLAEAGAQLLLKVLENLPAYTETAQAQEETQATYAKKITKAERRLDFSQDAQECLRQVRAFAPTPAAYCFIDGQRLNVLAAEVVECAGEEQAGTLIAADAQNKILIACGGGDCLRITRLQRAGRNAMAVEDFLRGYSLNQHIGQMVNDE